ncbi:hypothetical protein PTTG_02184 [Puccinia triticina 1-1 BBBD Race 1]|uniref:Rho-GAP domain-containing protein n=1 Tax=Puccinia triticina (isolate 1-1 / race 1 (BBBD)) TaxID=630390 RepID=A0A180GE34_PUCT1|nr:hypothetical protein PTTG_02184 [Puccinia triticina 1-1 BBBD Race 1]
MSGFANSPRTEELIASYTLLIHQAESFASFFKKRCEIEEDYHLQLTRLLARQHDADRRLDSEYPSTTQTARDAWQEMCANVAQEAHTRKSWIRLIRQNVIEPLERFRSAKERTLHRIRDELRSSINEHKEYLATVQRLKKNYDRKCDEVAQFHAMSEAVEVREKLIEDQRNNPHSDWEHISSSSKPSPNPNPNPNPPTTNSLEHPASTPHTPPSGRPSTDNNPTTTSRQAVIISGATSSALRDTLTPPPANPIQAKGTDVLHALRANTNNLIQRLNSRKDTAKGTAQAMNHIDDLIRPTALRGVKVKREAEEADREYRKGIFHLETLRLRKEQVIRGARRATEEMVYETSAEAKESFSYYNDETRIQAVSLISICDHAQHLVMKVNPDADVRQYTDSTLDEYEEPQVLYENAFIGPCRSLLFGVAINDYCASNPGKGAVPLIVKMCIEEIDRNGLKQEGIYRVSGKMHSVIQLVHEIEKDEDTFTFDAERHEIYTIAGVLKLYLRQLPQALFPFPLVERVSLSQQLEESREEAFRLLLKRIRRLPPSHQATLKLLCAHLHRIASFSSLNKMTPSNLGLVFSPVVFLDDPAGQQLPAQSWKDDIMAMLIEHHEELFQGLPTAEPATTGLERSRSTQSVRRTRTISPSARKSLEAVRYESYSISGSPLSSPCPSQPLGPEAIESLSLADQVSPDPQHQPPLGSPLPPPALDCPPHPDPSPSISNPPKRTFSIRRKTPRPSLDASH